ncbi:hypothetical protein [Sorangium sp. So ce176]|uniref:hypothetical protein n=1 Tax=Sorangium sp. So ce176 TaxID=3133286 RepID=UPI003F638A65
MLGQGRAAGVWHRYKFIGQPVMDAQIVFWLGLASMGLTDVGEVLDTATRVRPGDERSWFEQWLATAKRVRGYGEEAEARGHTRSAASHFLRAGAYYRAGLMRYADRADPRRARASGLRQRHRRRVGRAARRPLVLRRRELEARRLDAARGDRRAPQVRQQRRRREHPLRDADHGNQLLAQARLFDWLDERVAR